MPANYPCRYLCLEMDKMMNNLGRKFAVAAISIVLIFGTNTATASAVPAVPVASSQSPVGAAVQTGAWMPQINLAPQVKQVQQAASNTTTVDGVVLNHQEARMIHLVNQHRARHGIAPVRVSQQLTNQSRSWSKVQAGRDQMSHGPDNCYENVAWNNYDASADAFFQQWKESPGHNRNMLESRATKIGYGMKKNASTGRYYATMQLL